MFAFCLGSDQEAEVSDTASDGRFGLVDSPEGFTAQHVFCGMLGASNTLNSKRLLRGGISGPVSGQQGHPSGQDRLCELGGDYTRLPAVLFSNHMTLRRPRDGQALSQQDLPGLGPVAGSPVCPLCPPPRVPLSQVHLTHPLRTFSRSLLPCGPHPASAGDCRLK